MSAELLAELQASRRQCALLITKCDKLKAEIRRLRARIEVDRDDVRVAGVTHRHAQAWLDAHAPGGHVLGWTSSVVHVINTHATADCCALDILDQMAAMVIS